MSPTPFALLASLTLSTVALAAPTTYELGPDTLLDARIHKAGVASGLAHDHVLRARSSEGVVVYDPVSKALLEVRVSVPVDALVVDDPRARHAHGLEGEIDADDRAEIRENMRSKDQLWASRHRAMSFRSTASQALGGARYAVSGKLTIRGVTRDVQVIAEINASPTVFTGKGRLRITHAQFGFEPYSAMLGAVKNQQRIDLILNLKGTAVAPPPAPPSAPPTADQPRG